LPASKSISRQRKGAFSEKAVCLYLISKGCKVLACGFQTPFAEVDILAFHPKTETLALIEVKSQRLQLSAGELVSRRQAMRLKQAHLWLCHQLHFVRVRSMLVVVQRDLKLVWFSDFLS
jgi:putative endonuclease